MSVFRRRALLAFSGLPFAAVASAQDSLPRKLPPVVTVTRDVGRSPLDLPYSITSLRPDSVEPGQTHTFVEQTLSLLPGVTVANRTNPSQDTRISIRGFGARSQFGARSIRILRDGMPLTLPDGQTPIDYLDLESVGRVEAIRGAASSLYGNASGGVIDLRSVDPPTVPLAGQLRSFTGANGLRRYTGLFGGTSGDVLPRQHRPHRERRLSRLLTSEVDERVRARIDVRRKDAGRADRMGLDMPVAENPGALTRAQADAAPEQADAPSVTKKARKAVHQVQLGLSAQRPVLGSGELQGQGYSGTRTLFNPLTFAVVGVGRKQGGAGARFTLPWTVAGVANRVSIGADAQWLNDARRELGELQRPSPQPTHRPIDHGREGRSSARSARTRDEHRSIPARRAGVGRLRATAGVRADRVRFEVQDHFLARRTRRFGIRDAPRGEPDARRRRAIERRCIPCMEMSVGVRDANDDGARQSGRRVGGVESRSQAAVFDDIRSRREGIGDGARAVRRRAVRHRSARRADSVRGAGRNRAHVLSQCRANATSRRGGELATDIGPVSLTSAYALSQLSLSRFRERHARSMRAMRSPAFPSTSSRRPRCAASRCLAARRSRSRKAASS